MSTDDEVFMVGEFGPKHRHWQVERRCVFDQSSYSFRALVLSDKAAKVRFFVRTDHADRIDIPARERSYIKTADGQVTRLFAPADSSIPGSPSSSAHHADCPTDADNSALVSQFCLPQLASNKPRSSTSHTHSPATSTNKSCTSRTTRRSQIEQVTTEIVTIDITRHDSEHWERL